MSATNNLSGQAAIEKIRNIATSVDIAMFCCNLGQKPFDATPMSTQQVDEQGNIWFMSGRDSERNQYLLKDADAQLIYGKRSSSEYLSLFGRGEIVDDQSKKDELYAKIADAWFEGPNDPKLTLIKFVPSEGHYWDTKNGGLVAFAKILFSAYTSAETSGGVSGKIDV